MEDNTQPQISVTQALNQIQSWLNAGEVEKVIQGCQEILELEPGNQRALSLMKQAEEKRHFEEKATQTEPNKSEQTPQAQQEKPEGKNEPFSKITEEPEPAQSKNTEASAKPTNETTSNTETTPQPEPNKIEDPLAKLEVENKPEMFEDREDSDSHEKRKLFLAMLIPAILVVVIGGGIIWFLADEGREEIIDEIVDEVQDEDYNYLTENEERVEVLTDMAKALEEYEAEHGEYPSVKKVEDVLLDSNYFNSIPVDARQGEFDKSGKLMGYMYAVYDTIAGDNTAYVVSALFEDSRGFGYSWTRGASTKNYEDYRDIEENNVVFIGGDEEDIGTYDPNEDKEESSNETENKEDDEPKAGPKVPTS